MQSTAHWLTSRQLASAARMRWFSALSTALIAVLALLPRVWDLGRFITFDEANFWLARSAVFLQAISSGDFGATAITVHPGVTTMWLGGSGILLHRALQGLGWLVSDTFATRLAIMQLPAAVVHAAAIVLGYRLMLRLAPIPIAFAGALLWAVDPFVIGYSRILHVDALAGTFLTLSLLAACCYWNHRARVSMLALSAVCGSLAVLSKSPAAALLPVIFIAGLASDRAGPRADEPPLWGRVHRAAGPLVIWGAIALVTALLAWPALLAAPGRVLDQLRLGVTAEGAQPHQLGNFFLGRAYAEEDPGLRYYPVALVLRATPWTLVGLLLSPLALRQSARSTRRDLLVLAGFVVLFTLTMDLFPKKFDRYLVPAFPAIDLLAAAGLYAALEWANQILRLRPRIAERPAIGTRTLTLVLAALGIGNLIAWHPYEIGAFNQVLGGARAGVATFAVGWGEGLEQAADWLNQQPDITGVTVAALRTEPLQPYLRPGAQAVSPPAGGFASQTGYVVVYLPDVRDGRALPPFDRYFEHQTPAHEVIIHGVTYAWIYQVPPPVANQLPASFNAMVNLRGYDLAQPVQPGKPLKLQLYWASSANVPASLALFVHVLGSDGSRYAQADPPLGEAIGPHRFFETNVALDLPPTLAPGRYQLVIGVYDRTTGQRYTLQMVNAQNIAADGPDALKVAEFDVGAL